MHVRRTQVLVSVARVVCYTQFNQVCDTHTCTHAHARTHTHTQTRHIGTRNAVDLYIFVYVCECI